MGLGVWMLAEPERRGLLKRKPAIEPLLKEVADTLCRTVVEACPLLGGYVRAWQNDPSSESDGSVTREWLVRLHPADEEVRISNHRGRVLFAARTNGAGPGYHACLIDALDRVVARCRLRWVLAGSAASTNGGNGATHLAEDTGDDDGEDADSSDETGYFEHRDFNRLRKEMLTWLRAVARHVAEQADEEIQMISMAIGTPIREHQTEILTPLGERPRSFFEAIASSDDAALEQLGSSFFPWWHAEFSSADAGKLARTLLVTLPWHPPESDEERALVDVALACLDSSPEALAESGIDDLDVAELRRLRRETPETATAPRPGGFGLLRGRVWCNPFRAVSLVVPGYFYQRDEDDAKTYWFGDRAVRVACFDVRGPEGPAPPEGLLETARSKREDAVEVRSLDPSDEAPGYTLSFVRDEEAPSIWHGFGGVARSGKLALVTITFSDRADFDWAEEIVRSVRLTDDEDEPE